MTAKRAAGRPEAVIDWNKVGKYLQAQCSAVGIAGLFGISVDTLYIRCKKDHNIDFSAYSAQKKAEGKELLRMKMFSQAMEEDKTIQIWLSKQYLDMSDKQNINVDIDRMTVADLEYVITETSNIINRKNHEEK